MLSSAHNEENARRAFVLRRAILLPRAVEPMAPRLHPTFSGGFSQWRTFVPAAKAASVHSCAHSAVRVGFPTPFLLGRHLAVFRPLRYPPHSILGHDSIIRLCVLAKPFLSYSIRQEKSTVRPMQNGCVLQDCNIYYTTDREHLSYLLNQQRQLLIGGEDTEQQEK